VIIADVQDPCSFSAPPLISPMIQAGDLDSQGEKLNRIRALSLTPEFTAPRDMPVCLLFFLSIQQSMSAYANARACMISGLPTPLPGM
jgi:hypothetical protein